MRAVRIPLFVLLAVLFFILWNAAWVTDRCGEWTVAGRSRLYAHHRLP